MYDFTSRQLTCISAPWPLKNPINAHFAPDGRAIVFGAIMLGEHPEHDIYYWRIGDPRGPTDLLPHNNLRNEDAQFSPDGKSIIFKQNNQIAILNATGVHHLPIGSIAIERSGPCYAPDGRHILFWEGVGSNSDIYECNLDGSGGSPLAATPDMQDYYPTPWTGNCFLYVGGFKSSSGKLFDHIFSFDLDTKQPLSLPFNSPNADSSDPCAVDARLVVFSSTRQGGQGGYDLYLGDAETGQVTSLSDYNPALNTAQDELGVAYSQ